MYSSKLSKLYFKKYDVLQNVDCQGCGGVSSQTIALERIMKSYFNAFTNICFMRMCRKRHLSMMSYNKYIRQHWGLLRSNPTRARNDPFLSIGKYLQYALHEQREERPG